MAAGRDHVLSMPCRFINYLIGTSIRQLIQNMDVGETDFFDYDVVIMPFEEDGQRSLFWCWERGTSKITWNATFGRPGHVYCMSFHMKHRHVHKCTLTMQRLPGSAHGSMLFGEWNTANRRMTQCLSPIALCQQHVRLVCTFKNTHILTRQRCFGVMYSTF